MWEPRAGIKSESVIAFTGIYTEDSSIEPLNFQV